MTRLVAQTRLNCAIQGFKTLLGELWPCKFGQTCDGTDPVDLATVLQFPPVQKAPTAGGLWQPYTVAPYAGINGATNSTTSTGQTTLQFSSPLPPFPTGTAAGSSSNVTNWPFPGQVTDMTSASAHQGRYLHLIDDRDDGSDECSRPVSRPCATNDDIAVWPPVYQLLPLSERLSDLGHGGVEFEFQSHQMSEQLNRDGWIRYVLC